MSEKAGLQLHRWLHPKFWGMWLFFGFLRLVTLLPLQAIEAVGAFLGWLLYRLAPSRRRVSRINIQQAYPEYNEIQIKNLIRASYRSLGISVFEMALAWWASRDYLRKHCTVEGTENLDAELEKGKGVIMLTGHFSTLEIGGILLALYTPLNAVYKKAHNPMFNTFMDFYRNKHLKKAIPNTNVRDFIKGLRNGVATWYAPDQDFTQNIVFAPFLGGIAGTLTSTAKMAEMTNASIVPFYPQRLDNGKGYKLVILPALENFPTGDQLKDASRINQAIEQMVRKNPEQYAWIHKRFKTQPDGQPSIY
ncbi:MAG: LpxL/LpxP family Kdo(2)-lipid IV(A) lauroyl/palmitoleoyl acyltransferase [Gammaproteobacteria bacterium]|nr:LpxL/LpxP family Kdo(2)-lipid IV(A) lauroyl/palmitoleoyl acyltransferase [Gammaproteobacteria bacterium]MCW8924371.1 LpxL/LpxP family Kdo(2)-lipid IV(A) lauroyl/palmitoleoyl acyltransferase [Gammaproteobacteria bacterium]